MLPENRRTQLDGIVQQMVTNGESDDDIQFVVNDFKTKYSAADTPTPKPQEPGFLSDVATAGAHRLGNISNPKDSRLRKIPIVGPSILGPASNVAGQGLGFLFGDVPIAAAKALTPEPVKKELGQLIATQKGNPIVDIAFEAWKANPEDIRNDYENLMNISMIGPQGSFLKGAVKGTAAVGREGFNIARDVGTLTGQAAKKGVGKIIPKNAPQSLIESGAKWSTTLSPEKRKALSKTMIGEKINLNNKGYDKLNATVDDINNQIKTALEPHNDKLIDAYKVTERTSAAMDKAKKSYDPMTEMSKVTDEVNTFLDNWEGKLTVSDAQSIKQDIYKQLKGHYDSVAKGGPGKYTDGEIAAKKNIARGLKEEIENAVHDAPIKELNARETELLRLEPHLRRAVGRIENHNIFSLDDALAAGAGTLAGTFAGGPVGALIGGAAGGLAKRALGHPATKAKMAMKLDELQNAGVTLNPRSAAGKAILGELSGLENILAREGTQAPYAVKPGIGKLRPAGVNKPVPPGTELGPVRSGRTVGQPYGPAAPTLIQRKQLPPGQGFELNGPAYAPDVIDANFTATSRPIPETPQLVAPGTIQGQLRLPAGQGFELVDRPVLQTPKEQIGTLMEVPPVRDDFIGSGMRAARERMAAQQAAKAREAENLVTRVAQIGIKWTQDYNPKILRQNPDLKRTLNNKHGQSPDAIAYQLQAEGWPVESGDQLIELLKSGKGRTIYNPEKADKLFARDIRRMENEWAENQIAKLNETEPIDTRSIRESVPDIETRAIDEIGSKGLVEERNLDKALKELSDFFAEMGGKAKAQANKIGQLVPEEVKAKLKDERGSFSMEKLDGSNIKKAKTTPQAEAGFTKVFRGEYQGNKKGNYYSPDVEFARQFTQSGLDKEIIEGFIKNKDIYRPKEDVYAGDPDAIEGIVQEAKNNGFKAVELSEGDGQPKSIYVIDRSAVKSTKQYTELPNPSRPPEGKKTLGTLKGK